jgi:hypothetical protein
MATLMNRHSPSVLTKTSAQKVCISLGVVFIAAGLIGIVVPDLIGMHLSLTHNILHLGSGAISLWVGYGEEPRKAYMFSLVFGIAYALMGIAGFVFGTEGYSILGARVTDQNLFRIIPDILEFGTMDHLVHMIFGFTLCASAFIWKKRQGPSAR